LSKTKGTPATQQLNSLFMAMPKQRPMIPTPPQRLMQIHDQLNEHNKDHTSHNSH